jgi:hypothetical protein
MGHAHCKYFYVFSCLSDIFFKISHFKALKINALTVIDELFLYWSWWLCIFNVFLARQDLYEQVQITLSSLWRINCKVATLCWAAAYIICLICLVSAGVWCLVAFLKRKKKRRNDAQLLTIEILNNALVTCNISVAWSICLVTTYLNAMYAVLLVLLLEMMNREKRRSPYYRITWLICL